MNIQRKLILYYQRHAKGKSPLLIAILIACLILSWKTLSARNFHLICPSERHQHFSDFYRKTGLHVISSAVPKVSMRELKDLNTSELLRVVDPNDNECLKVMTPDRADSYVICIHDPYRDVIVSGHVKGEGSWEQENIRELHEIHREFPDTVFVDLGCSIGVFTIPAAKLGMEVIAVDAMLDSLRLLQRSLVTNGFTCSVTLVHNAIHRKRMKMRMVIDPVNIGGARVQELDDNHHKGQTMTRSSQLVDAICLDHLVPLVKERAVFLKIDLEGSEAAIFKCAEYFFSRVTVKVLLIEWSYLRKSSRDSALVSNFLVSHGMEPTASFSSRIPLDIFATHSWPEHVYWLKR